MPGPSEGSKGGAPIYRHRDPWAGKSGTEFNAKTEVSSGGKLDVEDVERGETYIGTGGIYTREKMTRFLQRRH